MQIKIDLKGMADAQAKLARLSGKQMNSALTAALNKTAAKGQAELNRAITERYNIKAADVRNSVTLRKASATQGFGAHGN
ncbi:MAG: phage tail protein [Rhodoferax sp.]